MRKDRVSAQPSEETPLYLIGKNGCGRWVVLEEKGQSGGIFVERSQAIKFAMYEGDHGPRAVVMVPGRLELDLHRHLKPGNGHH
ncbi:MULTISPECIES: hypothetical protein [Rhodomicrobium]|uniref:hypothetical protein n=1 Tax=Rhodomicrobium TaxID=1068 RepID=UPI000B4B9286|nr:MULTISPECIES: hypothetical protein [Rhodomicrobium]